MQQRSERIESLDSIRGLAALQVVVHHSLLIIPLFWSSMSTRSLQKGEALSNLFTFSPLHTLWAGQEAVILFFVLSGFVLSMPYYKNSPVDYPGFFIKRVFRIYFPYLIALIIGTIGNVIFNSHARIPHLSDWFNDIWCISMTRKDWSDFLLLKAAAFHNVVTSLWTIPIEIKVSLFFPLFVLILRRLGIAGSLLLLFGNVAFYMIGKRLGFQEKVADFSLFYYLTFFLTGAIVCKYRSSLIEFVDKLSFKQVILLIILAILLYTYSWNIQWLPVSLLQWAEKLPRDYAVCLAGVIFIIICISHKAPQWINGRYLILLGRISFSLYLIHPIVIGVVGFLLGNTLPLFWLVLLCILASLACAMPVSKYIEIPLQNAGRDISRSLKKRKVVVTGYEK